MKQSPDDAPLIIEYIRVTHDDGTVELFCYWDEWFNEAIPIPQQRIEVEPTTGEISFSDSDGKIDIAAAEPSTFGELIDHINCSPNWTKAPA